jgi:hypothetical protein
LRETKELADIRLRSFQAEINQARVWLEKRHTNLFNPEFSYLPKAS